MLLSLELWSVLPFGDGGRGARAVVAVVHGHSGGGAYIALSPKP